MAMEQRTLCARQLLQAEVPLELEVKTKMTPKRRVGSVESSSESESEESNHGSYIPSEMLSEVPSDVIIQSRIKYGSKRQMLEAFLMEYSGKTSLHGIRYIFQRRRPMCERVMWVIIFMVSFVLSCLVIHKVHMKWQESPVIVGFDEALVPIHRIPFPTITICPEARMETNIFDFRKVYKQFLASNASADDLSQDELERLAAALHVCDLELAKAIIDDLPNDLDPAIVKTLRGVAVSKNETAPFCKWNNRYYFCENIFTFVATDDGICYQFNGLSPADFYRNESYAPEVPDDIKIDFNNYPDRGPNSTLVEFTGNWSMEEGYMNQTQHSYPQRLVSASATNALTVLLQGLEHNFDYKCRGLRQGYKVFLNSPGNVVISSSNYMLAGHKRDIMMQIYPVYTTTSNAVREFTPERRQCFFNSERYLRFFKQYSDSNCQFECLTNYTISKCGCVKFTMPKPEDVRVCNHTDIMCYNEAEDDLMMIQQNEILQKLKDPLFESECNCLPGCVSLNYNFDISQARMGGSGTIQASNDTYDEHPDFMWTLLTVHFKDQQFTAIKRSELYTVSTLIANYGGVLSLFIGFSILSIVELVYFVTIRLKNSLKVRDSREDDSD